MNLMDEWGSITNNHECGIGKIKTKRDLQKQKNVTNLTRYSICLYRRRGNVSHFMLVISSNPTVKVPIALSPCGQVALLATAWSLHFHRSV